VAVLADALVTFFLQGAEQLALQVERDLADFIEKEGSAPGGLETTGAIFDCSGEGALRVAEELAFVEFLGNGGAVDADESLLLATAAAVDFAGDQLLAGAGFTEDEDRGVGGGDESNLADDLAEGGALADEITERFGFDDLLAQVGVLLLELGLEALDLLEGAGVGDGPGDVVGEDAPPDFRALGDVLAAEDSNDTEDLALEDDGDAIEAANGFRLEPLDMGEIARVLIQVAQGGLLSGGPDFTDDPDAERDAGEAVREGDIFLLAFGRGDEVAFTGDGMEAAGLVGALGAAAAGGAKIALVDEPDADPGDIGAV
jgi:hypothetical protein